MILIKPKKGNEKGEVALSVGYGLEGVIPDITASRIIRNEIIPSFQQGNYYIGINKATNVLMDRDKKGEFTAEEYEQQSEGSLLVFIPLSSLLFYFFLFGGVKDFLPDTPPVRFLSEVFHSGAIAEVSAHSAAEMAPFGGFGGGSFGGGGASGSW